MPYICVHLFRREQLPQLPEAGSNPGFFYFTGTRKKMWTPVSTLAAKFYKMKGFLIVIAIMCTGALLSFKTTSTTHEHKRFSQCVAMLATGFRCVSDARFGSTYCAFHSYPIPLQCVVVINGYPCPNLAVANLKCESHQNYQPIPPPDLNCVPCPPALSDSCRVDSENIQQ